MDLAAIDNELREEVSEWFGEPVKPYRYRPLEGRNQIRLVKFDVTVKKVVKLRLFHFDLAIAPPYVAVSYTWGDPSLAFVYTIDDEYHIGASKNLYYALDWSAIATDREGLLFWVDAICINQSDEVEKAAQVRIMKQVYERAAVVKAFIGAEEGDSDFAMEKLVEWTNELNSRVAKHSGNMMDVVSEITPSDIHFYGPKGSDNVRAWKALSELCRRPWWSRVWILQEATGPAPTHLACGQWELKWETLMNAAIIAAQLGNYPGLTHLNDFDNGRIVSLVAIQSNRRRKARTEFPTLLESLAEMRRRDCTDDRDRVYAALGVASNLVDGGIIPNYSLTVSDVYTDVTTYVRQNYPPGHRLDFLGHVINFGAEFYPDRASTAGYPSWLPDWRTNINLTCFPKFMDEGPAKGRNVYNASGDKKAEKISVDGSALKVTGLRIDQVTSVLPILKINLSQGAERWLRSYGPDFPSNSYKSGGTRGEAYLHTLIADVRSSLGGSVVSSRGYSVDWDVLQGEVAALSAGRKVDAVERTEMQGALVGVHFCRRVFWTREGYLGLGPAAMQVGDEIVVLFGGQMLYVVRDREGEKTQSFVGECYVHGLMDGEAVRKHHRWNSSHSFTFT